MQISIRIQANSTRGHHLPRAKENARVTRWWRHIAEKELEAVKKGGQNFISNEKTEA